MDYGFIALKDYMGGDETIERAARVSYGAGTRKKSDTRNLLRYLVRKRHSSPLEHVELQFHVSLPIFVARQWIRHRNSSTNEYSARYSIMPMMFYTPEQYRKQSQTNKQGSDDSFYVDGLGEDVELGRRMTCRLYNDMIDKDVSRELARCELPLSTYTFWYWKMDLHNLFHFLKLRLDSHAQWEIRQYAKIMAGIVKVVAPIAFEAFEDYILNSVSFTQMEIKLLMSHENPLDLTNFPGSKREANEFAEKLKLIEKQNFDLDLPQAKSGEHFEKIIQKHARIDN